ncbi:helix-turn-helix domain-containing protein [Pantoea agglomerans]|uniref:helix-turn-helix domain-containing protein n=1 Tax=Enterobacter agglomerans TaxID=549 RepID=UPI0017817228|nr:helix-turn-helix transcriptional regulator [Pantoea agglomerans]MBD8133831.1 helix-turn-helix transcriptional regulator [Pantoea agglomerans]
MSDADCNEIALFGRKIRELRSTKSISQEELAWACELDRTYISGIERGIRNPSLKNIIKIANALNIKLSELFEDF